MMNKASHKETFAVYISYERKVVRISTDCESILLHCCDVICFSCILCDLCCFSVIINYSDDQKLSTFNP